MTNIINSESECNSDVLWKSSLEPRKKNYILKFEKADIQCEHTKTKYEFLSSPWTRAN